MDEKQKKEETREEEEMCEACILIGAYCGGGCLFMNNNLNVGTWKQEGEKSEKE